jgi:hypothetical protein
MQLYTPWEIGQIQQDLPHLNEILAWVKSFLAKHHPDLGRPGSVCPYVPHSLKSNSIKMAVIHAKDLDHIQLENIILNYRNIFLKTAEEAKEISLNLAFVLIFPDMNLVEASDLIDGVQKKLKPLFVESGLMLGEFHQRNQSPGIHNANFRPLRSPIPLLAIRFMVEADLIFLQNPDPHIHIRYLEAYLNKFVHTLQDEVKLRNIQETLTSLKAEIKAGNVNNLITH